MSDGIQEKNDTGLTDTDCFPRSASAGCRVRPASGRRSASPPSFQQDDGQRQRDRHIVRTLRASPFPRRAQDPGRGLNASCTPGAWRPRVVGRSRAITSPARCRPRGAQSVFVMATTSAHRSRIGFPRPRCEGKLRPWAERRCPMKLPGQAMENHSAARRHPDERAHLLNSAVARETPRATTREGFVPWMRVLALIRQGRDAES